MRKHIVLTLVISVAAATNLVAKPLLQVPLAGGYFDSQYSAGAGANSAYFVVDFAGTPTVGGGVYGFDYHWDGTQTADNALLAIDAAGAFRIEYHDGGDPGAPNLFIDRLTFPPDSDRPDYSADQRFWNYWLGANGAGGSVHWTPSDYGISGREFEDFGNGNGIPNEILQTLVNGSYYGFYAAAYSDDPPRPRLPATSLKAGDFNLDGQVNSSDISAMLTALADLQSYKEGNNTELATMSADQLLSIGDVNQDGSVNNSDIQALLDAVALNIPAQGVPEPSAGILAVFALIPIYLRYARFGEIDEPPIRIQAV